MYQKLAEKVLEDTEVAYMDSYNAICGGGNSPK
jgi:hypothetical protein